MLSNEAFLPSLHPNFSHQCPEWLHYQTEWSVHKPYVAWLLSPPRNTPFTWLPVPHKPIDFSLPPDCASCVLEWPPSYPSLFVLLCPRTQSMVPSPLYLHPLLGELFHLHAYNLHFIFPAQISLNPRLIYLTAFSTSLLGCLITPQIYHVQSWPPDTPPKSAPL